MTLQTDLQDAVMRAQNDTQILHNIIHGDDQTLVSTDGGNVKTIAKTIKDIESTIWLKHPLPVQPPCTQASPRAQCSVAAHNLGHIIHLHLHTHMSAQVVRTAIRSLAIPAAKVPASQFTTCRHAS